MTPETKVKRKVKELLRKYGHQYNSPLTFGMGHSGWPDITACIYGIMVTIEAKSDLNFSKPTALQMRVMDYISKARGTPLVVDGSRIELLEKFLQDARGLVEAHAEVTPSQMRLLAIQLGLWYAS